MSKKWFFILSLCFVFSTTSLLQAQSADDVLRYSLEYPSYDPVSLVMPAMSQPTGFGAYQANPAVAALYDKSFFSFDLSTRFIDESSQYLGNSSTFSANQTNVGDLGFVYKVPTARGSLVIGAGYSQTTDFNRAFSANGFNGQSTLTDFYASLSRENSLNEAAFNAFAIEDVSTDSSVSIFRFGNNYSAYPGINQDVELTEKGVMGEYSAFLATEFLKNFSLGVSLGYLNGTYSYRREFLESDRRNNYEGQFIDADGDGNFETDIDRIESIDSIEGDIQAFSARVGIVYEPSTNFSVGLTYQIPSVLNIDENYNTRITTTFDNGSQTGTEEAPGTFLYKVERPSKLKAGFSFVPKDDLTISFSAERVRYSETRIQYEELRFSDEERSINGVIQSSFNDVVNLRAGLEYKINDYFTPRVGYAYFPSPQDGTNSERQFLSGGFSAELTKGLMFDFGLQYSFWDDQNALYTTTRTTEVVQEEVTRLHVMAGLRMAL